MKTNGQDVVFFVASAIASITLAKVLSEKRQDKAKCVKKATKSMPSALRREATQILDGSWKEFIVVTRIHTTSALKIAEPKVVEEFVVEAAKYAHKIVICVGFNDKDHLDSQLIINCADYITQLEKHIKIKLGLAMLKRITFLPVHPWGSFTGALNCALLRAVEQRQPYICYQSLEFRIAKPTVHKLIDYMKKDPNHLVIGPCLPGHDFLAGGGETSLRGRTCPWNTFAIWSVANLGVLGFPLVGDGMGTKFGGVEEVTAVALAQHLYPELKAVLLRVNGVEWDTKFSDPKRIAYHETKMRSKDERPQAQLEALGLESSTVFHVDARS